MKHEYKNSNPGVNYDAKTGKLFVFTSSSITVMKPWPPYAWQKSRRKPNWAHVRPSIKIPCHDIEGHIRQITTPIDETGQLLLPLFMPDESIDYSEHLQGFVASAMHLCFTAASRQMGFRGIKERP